MKTTPRDHQSESFERTRGLREWAHFWEMGTGKTWMGIAQAEELYKRGEIDALLVIAPPSVHEMWVTDELPKHAPDIPWTGYVYFASNAKTKKSQQKWRRMLEDKFPVFVVAYSAFTTKRGKNDGPEIWMGKDLIKRFLKKRRCLYILDESQRCKTPNIRLTKAAVASGQYAEHKRILSGTPITNSPFDVWSQINFLDPTFWARKGFGSLHSFKTTFGAFKTCVRQVVGKGGKMIAKEFPLLLYYRNLDYLAQLLGDISDRVRTEEVLDLPERTFMKRYFKASPEQKKLYKQMQQEYFAFLEDGVEMISAPLAITRLQYFQKILSGYITLDKFDGGDVVPLKTNPRLDCLKDLLKEEVPPGEKVIIWAAFDYDVDVIMEALGDRAVQFDGRVKDTDRGEVLKRFREDQDAWYLVSKACCGGTGLTLNEARNVVYYTNTYMLADRLQSQARNYRLGQTGTVRVWDLVCEDLGSDKKLVRRLRDKREMQATVMRDELKEWI